MLGDYFAKGIQEPKFNKFNIGLFEISRIDGPHDPCPIFGSITSKFIICHIVVGPYFIGIIGQIKCILNCSSPLNKILFRKNFFDKNPSGCIKRNIVIIYSCWSSPA